MNLRVCAMCNRIFNADIKLECCGMSFVYSRNEEEINSSMKNKYKVNGDETIIYLKYKGKTVETIIETTDLEEIIGMAIKWFVWTSKKTNGKFYVKANTKVENGKRHVLYLHRVICKPPEELQVDHINRNPLDNRRSNLRAVTAQVNLLNREISSSGHEGVSWDRRNEKWKAYLYVDGKQKQIGRFNDKEEAKKAVYEAKEKLIS